MSPVARRPGGAHTGRAVAISATVVVLALALAFGVATLASSGDVDVRLGDDRFEAGDTESLLSDIREREAPLGFNDVARFQRPIWVDNPSGRVESGWIALGAFLPDDPDCLVQWDAEENAYVAECDASRTFPRSGEGLRTYPTEVVDGNLFIDLQDPQEQSR